MVAVAVPESRRVPPTRDRNLRLLYRIAIVFAVSPIIVAAVRNGLSDWEPTMDAAITTVRIRDVFSARPPLIGMAAFPSQGADTLYSFPGAFALYLLAVPVELLGVQWGIPIGMAAINTSAAVVGLWFLRRRLGERATIFGAAVFASLAWSVGSQMLVDPTPVQMGIIPMFTLFVAAWSVADGDAPALLLLAVVGNYLFLGQLKYTVLVPTLGLFALATWIWRARRERRVAPDSFSERWKIDRRWLLGAVAFTVLVWIPPLVDQFFVSGNLSALVDAGMSGSVNALQPAELKPTVTGALGLIVSVTAVPPLWLPSNFVEPPFDQLGGGTPFLVGLGCALVLVALAGWVVTRSRQRNDLTIQTAVATAVVAWLAYFITALQDPSAIGYTAHYYYGLWSLSAFLWMVIIVGLARTLPVPETARRVPPRALLGGGMAAVVLLSIAAYPQRDHRAVDMKPIRSTASRVRDVVAAEFPASGPVIVTYDSLGRRFRPSALLGLQDAGTPFRVTEPFDIRQFGRNRDAALRRDVATTLLVTSASTGPEGARLIGRFPPRTRLLSTEDFSDVNARMVNWAASLDKLTLDLGGFESNPLLLALQADLEERSEELLASGSLLRDESFLDILLLLQPLLGYPVLDVPGVDSMELFAWANDQQADVVRLSLYEIALDGD